MTPAAWVRASLLALAMASSLVGASTALASIVDAMSLEELARAADVVLVGRVEGQRAHYDAQGRIVTDVTLRVDECLHGGLARGAEVTAQRLGGEVGDLGLRVEGEASYVDGERLVLFGRRFTTPAGTVLRPVGMSQGVLPIDERSGVPLVLPGGAGLELVERTPDGRLAPAEPALVAPRPADELVDELRTLVAEIHGGR